jgi:hypothetical protein
MAPEQHYMWYRLLSSAPLFAFQSLQRVRGVEPNVGCCTYSFHLLLHPPINITYCSTSGTHSARHYPAHDRLVLRCLHSRAGRLNPVHLVDGAMQPFGADQVGELAVQ